MNEDLLPIYNRELSYFRRMAAGFAEANPKIAGRLRLGADSSEDPHVERLIEAFAFLAARVRHKLEDDFPEITDALLGTLYPHYLAPLPASAIVKLLFDPNQGTATGGHTVEAGAEVETELIQGEPCRFRTCYNVDMWPVEVDHAQLKARPYVAPATPRSTESVAAIQIRLRCISEEVEIGELAAGAFRFFLKGLPHHVLALYELLFNHTLEVAIAASDDDTDPQVLPAEAIRPVGFGRDEGLLPYSARSPLGYRILTEYFAYPQKFLFFDLEGIDLSRLAGRGRDVNIFIFLNQSSLDLEQNISAETFQLNCTPVINLFEQRAEPIELTETGSAYRVVPDARRPLSVEVYSVGRVIATSPLGDETEFHPFYSVRHAEGLAAEQAYWYASRHDSEPVDGEVDHGTEIDLTIVDLASRLAGEPGWYLDVESTCLNRDLPNRLPFGGDQPYLNLSQAEGPVAGVRCLTPPTPTRRLERRRGAMWRLISHLSLGHLSLVDGDEGASALREILRLYDYVDSPETRDVIDAIVSVSSRRVAGRVRDTSQSGVCRGVEVTVVFRSASFAEKGVFLFAMVIERFLALYCTINSFTKLVVKVQGRDNPLREFVPRSGENILV